jgi:hypothetical protein
MTKFPVRGAAARAKPAVVVNVAKHAPEPLESGSGNGAQDIERGARVRVTSGPFAGKSGVVQELVGRKSARVMLGLLPVQIDVDDLAPSGRRGRPRLTSSHRKPVPARS